MAHKNQSGQALVEYVLLLSIIVSMTTIMIAGVRSGRDKMWKQILCEVSAACPGCKATESARNAIQGSGACKN